MESFSIALQTVGLNEKITFHHYISQKNISYLQRFDFVKKNCWLSWIYVADNIKQLLNQILHICHLDESRL